MKKHTLGLNSIFIIYDLFFSVLFFVYLPFYFFSKKINLFALKEKLCLVKHFISNCIWIQAVSVGEVNLIEPLVKKLNEIYNFRLLITTTTLAGYKLAKEKYSCFADVIFFPLDISVLINIFLKRIKPVIFISVETEIWPNLFFALNRRNIPVVIINGRISDKAFKRYLIIKPIIKEVFKFCNYIGVQSSYYKERFIKLGADKEKIFITGNLKFESINPDQNYIKKIKDYIPIIKGENKFIIIAASTHNPEEKIIIDIYKDILEIEKISLIIAPRHLNRLDYIEKLISKNGFTPVRISNLKYTKNSIFLIDKIGELLYFYSITDICFVGGSLVNYGGHNILEPIYFLKPTIFGPYMSNFKDIADIVLKNNSAIMVKDVFSLKEVFVKLLQDQKLRLELSSRCLEVFKEQKTALHRNLEIINKCLG